MTYSALVLIPAYQDYETEREVLAPLDVSFETTQLEDADAHEKLSKADIIFVRDQILDGETISKMKNAKGIVRYGIGVDGIDLDAAKEAGIVVSRVNDYGADIEVADHSVAMLLAVARRIVSRDREVRDGLWQIGQDQPIYRIAGKTMGFLGYGRIASAVLERMKGFGIENFLAYDPFLKDAPEGVTLVDLETLANQSDFLSLHAPATEDTQGIISTDFLSKMKVNSILINCARGALVDEDALIGALQSQKLFGAALDVFAVEPPAGSRLLELESVVLSDHSAWYSEATVYAIQKGAAEEAKQILETGDAKFRVA